MSDTTIEWATKVLNPVRGCTKVSEGCRNCYAIKQAHRFHGEGMPFDGLTEKTAAGLNWTGKLIFVPIDKVRKEIKSWKEPERVFVNSMSDLFHEDVPFSFLDEVFSLFVDYPQHIFMILTKRPQRMLDYMNSCQRGADEIGGRFPWRNVWLGTSVENQKAADERITLLLQTPAAVRFLSCEPLLGPVDLKAWLLSPGWVPSYYDPDNIHSYPSAEPTNEYINWVIAGGESGHGARTMLPEWAMSLRDQCEAAGVPFFFKQWGGVNKAAAGRNLDGREWNEMPVIQG